MQLVCGRSFQEEISRIKQMPPCHSLFYKQNKYKILASSALYLSGAAVDFGSIDHK